MILLDTHMWIWWINRDDRLSTKELKALDVMAAGGPLLVSDISLWEVEANEARGNLVLPVSLDRWLRLATSDQLIQLQRITVEVVWEIRQLRSFHKDPGDRMIAATARVLGVPLATHDSKIVQSHTVPIWKP